MTEFVRNSNLDGFTVVRRIGKRPRVHMLRPFESCNTDDAPHKDRFAGSAEVLISKFGRVVPCLRCFPGPKLEEVAANEDASPLRGSFSPGELAQQVDVDEGSASEQYVARSSDEEVVG